MALTLSQTGIAQTQTINAWHVTQSVDAFTGIKAYDITISGSLTVIGPLYATASWATNALNANSSSYALSSSFATTSSFAVSASRAVSASFTTTASYAVSTTSALTSSYAVSASKVFIADNGSTDLPYTLVFKNSAASLDDYHQLGADGSNGPYYNPSTNTLTVPVISGSSVQATSLTGSLSGSVAGTASFATSASYALTSSYASNGVTNLSVGAFYDTTTQTLASNVSGAMTYNSITVSDGISVVSNSRLTVTRAGTYNIQFSSQFVPSGPGSVVYVWLRKNGTNVPYSNTEVHMQNSNQALVAAWNFIETLTPGEYLELMWYPIGATVDMATEVPTPGPAGNGNVGVPSVIVTMTQIK